MEFGMYTVDESKLELGACRLRKNKNHRDENEYRYSFKGLECFCNRVLKVVFKFVR